ncbi:MAG: SAM-dependent chlorinase/fluorinase [Thermoleophilia bacterium]|nr:SAM-dependent chlorinase/fluorinase [Thermoleophilia bacterium]
MRPAVTFLTDYGPHSEHAGALHAVIVARCPGVERVDLAHDVPPGDVRWGAILLARLAPLLPDAVHLAVVDPGVGTSRRGAAVRLAAGGALVGPDNGLLGAAADRLGATGAVCLDPARLGAAGAPATFHGRDLFAPAAARLVLGEPVDALGDRIPVADLLRPDLPEPEVAPGGIITETAGLDRFGNVALLARPEHLDLARIARGDRVAVICGGRELPAVAGRTFGDVPVGTAVLHADSHGFLAVAVNLGDAAAALGVTRSGARIAITRVRGPAGRLPGGSGAGS